MSTKKRSGRGSLMEIASHSGHVCEFEFVPNEAQCARNLRRIRRQAHRLPGQARDATSQDVGIDGAGL
jgi:hypothetical protein